MHPNRIHVIQHEINQGVSIARKEGVLASSGEYIMFLDGDDYLDVNACKDLYRQITKEKVDILQFGTTVIPRGGVSDEEILFVENFIKPYGDRIISNFNGDILNACFAEKKFGFSLWNKVYSGDIVRKAIEYYPDERFNLAEDLLLFFLISFFSKKYTSINKKYYFYNFGAGITGGETLNDKTFDNKIAQGRILKHIEQFVEHFDPLENTSDAVKQIRSEFVSDVVYNLIWRGELISRSDVLTKALSTFDKEYVLGELLEYYYKGNVSTKKIILELCEKTFLNVKNRKIKTVGTFYYRLNNGGVERVVSKLIPLWLDAGYQVVLFTEEIPSLDDYEYSNKIARVIIPKIRNKDKLDYIIRIKYWKDMIEKYAIDTMVYHAWFSEYLLLDLLALKSAGVSFIVHTHNFFGQGMKSSLASDAQLNLLLNDIYLLSDAIVTLTDVDYSWWNLIHDNVHKVINPSTFDISEIKLAELHGNNILWLARISYEKQPIDALKIMKVIIDRGYDAKMHFVGKADDDSFYQEFLSKITELDLEKFVEIHGFHTNVDEFYNNSSVFLCTSQYEGFLLTLAESKAHGLPAVIYDLKNLDFVRKAEGMKVVKQGDILAAAEAIMELLDNEDERKILGKKARQSVEEMYTINIANQWNDVFVSTYSKRKPVHETIDDQVVVAIKMFLEYSTKGIEIREEERIFWKNLKTNIAYDTDYKNQLDAIENMRTWKLIQKYRDFMDNSKLGYFFSKVRDILFKRKI